MGNSKKSIKSKQKRASSARNVPLEEAQTVKKRSQEIIKQAEQQSGYERNRNKLDPCFVTTGPVFYMLANSFEHHHTPDWDHVCFRLCHSKQKNNNIPITINVLVDSIACDASDQPNHCVIGGKLQSTINIDPGVKFMPDTTTGFDRFAAGTKVRIYYNTESRSGCLISIGSTPFEIPESSSYCPSEPCP